VVRQGHPCVLLFCSQWSRDTAMPATCDTSSRGSGTVLMVAGSLARAHRLAVKVDAGVLHCVGCVQSWLTPFELQPCISTCVSPMVLHMQTADCGSNHVGQLLRAIIALSRPNPYCRCLPVSVACCSAPHKVLPYATQRVTRWVFQPHCMYACSDKLHALHTHCTACMLYCCAAVLSGATLLCRALDQLAPVQ
jgi:hypothetical protein